MSWKSVKDNITKETRRESHEKTDKNKMHGYILKELSGGKKLTAKDIAVALYEKKLVAFPVRQAVAPRLTELVELGKVKVIGKAYDHDTGRNVAVYRLVHL